MFGKYVNFGSVIVVGVLWTPSLGTYGYTHNFVSYFVFFIFLVPVIHSYFMVRFHSALLGIQAHGWLKFFEEKCKCEVRDFV